MTMSQKLKQSMEMRGIKQCELAKATGITEVSISRYATGQRIPRTSELVIICKALCISSDWLLGLKD